MFYLNKDTELTTELLQKMINHFRINVEPKLTKYKNYYDGLQAILRKEYADASKPCNRTVINYCKNIVDSYCGYLATPGHISYRSNDDIEEIMEGLKYNDYQDEDSDFLLDALIYGVAAELMYIDNESHTRFKLINPTSCFGIYDDSLSGDLMYFVRMYKANEWDNSDIYNVDVYNDNSVKHYKMSGLNGFLLAAGDVPEEPHYFSQCPANIFMLPDEKSIFDCVMSIQDSFNEMLSAEVDDFQAFCDAYLTLTGVDAEVNDIAAMKENRVLLLPEGAVAAWLTKNANDGQVENILKRLHDSIYRTAACPDFSSESFVSGVSSGIAIQYRLTGMETRAGKIEAKMKKALQRNIPVDTNATIQIINSLKGIVSDATLLSQLDFIADVNAELEAVQQQKLHNMELYSFGSSEEEPEETEEDEAV